MLRSKRLAPILIKEVTRRVNLCDIWQAVYTAGVELPKPVAKCQYYHRSLNPQKLVSIGFSRVPPQFQKLQRPMEAMKRSLSVPDKPCIRGIRAMRDSDVPAVLSLLRDHLAKYKIAPDLNEDDVKHWILPRERIIFTYVVPGADGQPTDVVSFYGLPSTVLGNPQYFIIVCGTVSNPGTSGVQNKGSTTELPRTVTKGRTNFIALSVITSKLNAL